MVLPDPPQQEQLCDHARAFPGILTANVTAGNSSSAGRGGVGVGRDGVHEGLSTVSGPGSSLNEVLIIITIVPLYRRRN